LGKEADGRCLVAPDGAAMVMNRLMQIEYSVNR
jgi:hypothetical protein